MSVSSLGRAAWVVGWLLLSSFRDSRADEENTAVPIEATVPVLLRDQGVRQELKLTAGQEEAVDAALAEWNERLFRLRMLSPTDDADEARKTLDGFGGAARAALEPGQEARLRGLAIQANGWRSLLDASVAAELKLTPQQRKRIAAALARTQEAAKEVQEGAAAAGNRNVAAEAKKIAQAERDRVVKILSEAQQRKWLELVGGKYDLTTVRSSAAAAPELRGIDGWLNSEPLTLEGLRGRVVVLHFIAADCVNCVRNLPHYREWHEQFDGRGVTVIGVHTPETGAERDPEHVRKELDGHGVKYPVALDAELKTWEAWTNRMWPSTYLIDKRGQVRFWWYGELEWQGAGGKKLMRERIELLLAEE